MKANQKYLNVHFIILIILAFQSQLNAEFVAGQDNRITYQSVGDVIQGKNSDLNQGKGFHVFQIGQLQKKYLFFELKPKGQSKFLQISLFIYRGIEKTPFKICKKQQVDSCFVSKNDLQKYQQLMVIVECQSACEYEIKLHWSNIEHINPGDLLKFMFSEQKSQIYHLELQKTQDFAQLRLILKPQTRRQMFDKVKIYGKYGKDSVPSAEDYDFKSMHLWLDAQGIYLQRNQIKQLSLNFLVVGQSSTVYVMTCEVVNKTIHDVFPGQILDQYLQPQQVATYHINFTTNGKIEFQQYAFKFSAFNGNLSIGFFLDSFYTKSYTVQPYQYMSDAQFTFGYEQVVANLSSGIYVKIKSFDRISTYVMEFIGRSRQSAIQLKENIYEIIQIQQLKPKLLYFNSFSFQGEDKYQQNLTFTLHLINVKGSHAISFRVCEKDFQKCLSPDDFGNYSKVIQVKNYDQIGTKKTFRFEVPKSMLTNINKVQQKLTVLMVVSSISNGTSICALQYYSQNRYQLLRESRPIESRLKIHESKLYKFTNVDSNIKQVRMHINKINGIVNVISIRDNPQVKNDGKKQTSNILSFTEDLMDKPIYLIIFAEQEAILSIDVQLIHQNKDNVASISMQEDVEFKIKIQPQQVEFLEIHPVYDSLYFDYKASGLVIVCEYQNRQCKKDLPDMGIEGSIEVENFKSRSQLIMVQNPSDSRTISFTAIYHSSDYDHCEQKKIGEIFSDVIQNRICYSFPINKMEKLQILISHQDMGNLNTVFLICNNVVDLKREDGKQKYTIEKSSLIKNCQKQEHKALLMVVSGQKLVQGQSETVKITSGKDKQNVTIKAKIIVQYIDQGALVLPDGIAYETTKVAKQEALQVFYYEVLNKVNTTIILTNKIGNAYFTVKVAHTVDRHKYLSSNTFDFSSNNTNYYLNPVLSVSKSFLQKAECDNQCTLVIKVFSKDKIGTHNNFMMQVTQNYFVLQQHTMKSDFLTKDSITYYSFFNKQKQNSLLIQTSDNNKKCTKIILSDREYPSDVNNLRTQYGNQLMLQNAQNKTYFIAVQAIQSCGYSISISSTSTHITHLQRGKVGYLKLQQGQVKFFMFHRMTANPFKIISNHVYGQIEFHLNRTKDNEISQLVKQQSIKYEEFKIKSEYRNRLVMDQDLCENCYYLLACYAVKNTDTSIYLGDNDSFLPISEKKSINDLLKHKGDSLKGYYYDVQDTKLKVKVHSGKLSVKVKYYNQNYQKQFEKLDDLYEQQFNLKRKEDDWSPASVQLTALADDTLYSVRFQSKSSGSYSNVVDETQVSPGEPSYFYMTSERVFCLKGYLRDKKQMIMITADQLYEHGLKQMKIQVVVNGTQVKYVKQNIRNILTIKIPMDDTSVVQALQYSVCLSSAQDSFSATAFQTQDVNILPSDVETVAYGTQKYAIRPNGNFLIDVFQCVGKANITYSQSLNNLSEAKTNSLDILGMPEQPHAFKISQYLTTFLKIESQMSTIRWIPMDQKNETGFGYLHYKVGSIKYGSSDESVNVQWEGVSRKAKSRTKVKQINYTIYVSNQTQILQSAQNCDYFLNLQKILTYKVSSNSELDEMKNYQIKKKDLLQKYPQMDNLFVSIVAEVDIQPIKGDLQHYRFFYSKQQIPKDVFLVNTQYLNRAMYIGIIAAGIIAFLIFTYVCTKKIIPLLARLKNRMFVEEQDTKTQQLEDVPPSSERKTNIATEDKMSDQINKS